MLKQFLLFIALVCSLLGCARAPVTPPAAHPIQKKLSVSPFTRIKVEGKVDVRLHTGYKKPQVLLQGDPRDLTHVKVRVLRHVLIVELNKDYPEHGCVKIDIYTRHLNSVEYRGRGMILGKRLRSSLLDLSINNQGKTFIEGDIALRNLNLSGDGYTEVKGIRGEHLSLNVTGKAKVKLTGFTNLTTLNVRDDGWLSLYWIKSRTLVVRAKEQAYIQLAGVAERLDVELCGKALFNGRYLRAQSTFVKTHDQSVAEIATVKRQHTLASDNSNIYFYSVPDMRSDFMAFNGSVLDMRDWRMPYIEGYNRYNKH